MTILLHFSGGITKGLEAVMDGFFLNGKPITIYSGELHYFRVHPRNWRDRLRKMRACGLNCVSTWVEWYTSTCDNLLHACDRDASAGTYLGTYTSLKRTSSISETQTSTWRSSQTWPPSWDWPTRKIFSSSSNLVRSSAQNGSWGVCPVGCWGHPTLK